MDKKDELAQLVILLYLKELKKPKKRPFISEGDFLFGFMLLAMRVLGEM